MQLCFDATRFGFSLKEALELASAKKVPAVEFSFAPFAVNTKGKAKLSSAESSSLAELRTFAEHHGVSIACINLDYCWQPGSKSSGRQYLGMVNKLAVVAAELNCRRLSFGLAPGYDQDWKQFLPEVLPAALAAAAGRDVKLLLRLSTPAAYQGQSLRNWRALAPGEWVDLLAEYPGLSLSFSAADCLWQSVDYLQVLPGFIKAIEHVEAYDVEINRELLAESGLFGPLWWRYRLPGKGQIDWRQLLEALKLYGYDGYISLRLDDEFADSSQLEPALEAAVDLLTPYIRAV